MLSGKRILLGVTGGIAAYKAVYLLREFQKAGAEVRVTMTPSATRFVGTETFSALSRQPVPVGVFSEDQSEESWTRHIHWGEWADLFVIAPCTANTLAKIVQGESDNMLTATILAARCPILICPTMDGEMYESPAVSKNLNQIKEMGYFIQEPETGYLASGLEATGRLPEPETMLKRSDEIIAESRASGPLSGKNVLVTAGPTREYIDPVRFISNPSSGKMGAAMADAAVRLGGDVTLLKGPGTIASTERMQIKEFTSAEDLFRLIKKTADSDVIIMSAAVSDFRPAKIHGQKVKKDDASDHIDLVQNPDILKWIGKNRRDDQHLIGFAMETENLVENARKKLSEKNIDWICANSINKKKSAFESDSNIITLLGENTEKTFEGYKRDVAMQILREIFDPPH